MRVLISKKQYNSVILSEGEIKLTVNYESFNPDEKFQKTYVYINGLSQNDKESLINLKEKSGQDDMILLNNILTKESITISINDILFTKNKIPYIKKSKYDELLPILKKSEVKLDPYFLKKMESGFPKFITNLLYKLYPDNIGRNEFLNQDGVCESDFGLINIDGTNLPNQKWSILNFFDTNPMVITQLIKWYYNSNPDKISIENFEKWITDNKEELFLMGDKLKVLIDKNMTSYLSGVKTENVAIKNLSKKFNISINNFKQYCAGSYYDRKGGRDIEIINNKDISKFGQIKPLSSFNKIDNIYEVKTYQMKNYKKQTGLDYIIFSNPHTVLVFKNEGYEIKNNGNTVLFKVDSLVNEL